MDPSRAINTGTHELRLMPDMRLLLDNVYQAIGAAQRRVLIECYIVSSDLQGVELFRVLSAAASRGVRVQVLYDPLGSQNTDPGYFEQLRSAGVEVRSYGERARGPGGGLMGSRDHSRVILADGVAFTGGAAWGEQWLPIERGGRGWHDVCCRFQGPCVTDFERLFDQRWEEANDQPGDPDSYDTGARYPDLRFVADTPSRDESLIYEAHLAAFRVAARRIWIENSYFYPPPAMVEALREAVVRGVDVRILLPGESDLPTIQRASRAEYKTWLEHGFQLFEFVGTVMHAKFAIVDEGWSTVGTFNVNPVSVGLSNEVNVFVFEAQFVAAMATQFELDLARAKRVTMDDVEARTIVQRVRNEASKELWNTIDGIWGPRREKLD